jgi:hypothetical protein
MKISSIIAWICRDAAAVTSQKSWRSRKLLRD